MQAHTGRVAACARPGRASASGGGAKTPTWPSGCPREARWQAKRPKVAVAADSRCVGQGYAKGLAELRPYLTPHDFAQVLVELQARSPGRVEALAAAAAAAAAVQPPGPQTHAQAPGGAQRPAHPKGVDLPGWGAAHLAGAIGTHAAAVDAAAAAAASLHAQQRVRFSFKEADPPPVQSADADARCRHLTPGVAAAAPRTGRATRGGCGSWRSSLRTLIGGAGAWPDWRRQAPACRRDALG